MNKKVIKDIGYLKGLLEGIEFKDEMKEKLMQGLIAVLEDLSKRVDTLDDLLCDLSEYVESVDDALMDLEADDDDEDFDEVDYHNPFLRLVNQSSADDEGDEDDEDDEDLFDDKDEAPSEVAKDFDDADEIDPDEMMFDDIGKCPECNELFRYERSALEEPDEIEVRCPHCGELIHPISLLTSSFPMARRDDT